MLQPTLLTEMDNLVGLLYASGARRFLFREDIETINFWSDN